MERVERTVAWTAFGLTAAVILLAPWCFGAWEVWWFWPFLLLIFVTTALFGVQLLLKATHHETHTVSGRSGSSQSGSQRRRRRRKVEPVKRRPWRLISLLACLLFLGYAALRFLQAPVFADAQRSLFLFVTPFLLGLQIVYGFNGRRRRLLHRMIMFNLLLLGLYGLINHAITGSSLVLWRPGFPQYAHRASGSYFCPDHYAGIMEVAFCMALGVLCSRSSTWRWRIAATLLSSVAITGVLLSKSRGGGLTLVVILAAAWGWGLVQYPPRRRWALRGTALALVVVGLFAAHQTQGNYFKRVGSWFGWDRAREQPFTEAVDTVTRSVQHTSRWIMLSGAMRAWTDAPLQGIGSGMHQNIWPHVAASRDGDRAAGVWPTRLNNSHYSYEVHNDWAQLLEEYGLIGLFLALGVATALGGALLGSTRRSAYTHRPEEVSSAQTGRYFPLVTGAGLTLLAMAFHSLGDFNLQMPATAWLVAVVIAIGVASATRRASRAPSVYSENDA